MTLIRVDHDLDFSPLHQCMQHYVDQDLLACASTLVMRGTDLLDYRVFGRMDKESDKPLTEDAIYRMASNTKIVTSVALMMLYEQGKFALDDELSRYLPEFSRQQVLLPDAKTIDDVEEAKSPILIRHILSHTAGFSYGFVEPESLIDRSYMGGGLNLFGDTDFDLDLEEFCQRLSTMPLAYHPGTSWRYSFATDVCARLVEVLSGMKFDAFLRANIFTPLGMVDTAFWVTPEKTDRLITLYSPKDFLDPSQPGMTRGDEPKTGQFSKAPAFLSGGGGLVSSMSDYVTFLRMIINDGEWQGTRLLKPETIALMRTNQLAPGVGVAFPMWAMPGTVFGLGFALKQTLQPDDHSGAQNEYYWGGLYGTHSWMAPEAGITGMCSTQRMPGFWHPFSHDFRRMAYDIAAPADDHAS
ncbi:MAG: CubicO group peptidase (beta-lactamase class C family) [Candidatus Azotimanducaceae bacterium]|jgi:CubicO group peptidase (beta-lactamase class C family)